MSSRFHFNLRFEMLTYFRNMYMYIHLDLENDVILYFEDFLIVYKYT